MASNKLANNAVNPAATLGQSSVRGSSVVHCAGGHFGVRQWRLVPPSVHVFSETRLAQRIICASLLHGI